MSNEIIFDGDDTLNDLVSRLMKFMGEDTEVSSYCQLQDDFEGYTLEVTIRKNEQLHA